MKSTPKTPGRSAGRPAATGNRAANAVTVREALTGVISELRRVTWPSREEWVAATILTIVLVVGVGVFTYVMDLLFGWIFSFLTGGTR